MHFLPKSMPGSAVQCSVLVCVINRPFCRSCQVKTNSRFVCHLVINECKKPGKTLLNILDKKNCVPFDIYIRGSGNATDARMSACVVVVGLEPDRTAEDITGSGRPS